MGIFINIVQIHGAKSVSGPAGAQNSAVCHALGFAEQLRVIYMPIHSGTGNSAIQLAGNGMVSESRRSGGYTMLNSLGPGPKASPPLKLTIVLF
jgi:hypothetical protein